MKGLIAVDGGGTKTEFILADINGNVLSRSVYNGTNLNAVSYEEAFLTLAQGCKYMFDVAQQNDIQVSGAFFGLAGGASDLNREVVYNYFRTYQIGSSGEKENEEISFDSG